MGKIEDDVALPHVTIKYPVQVVSVPPRAASEASSIAFVPFLEFCEEFKTGIQIAREDILCTNKPVIELENQYNSIFGSGIQIAKSL
jgi:hypothetical protein